MQRILSMIILLTCLKGLAQPGKNGQLTITTPNYAVNKYYPVSYSIAVGANTVAAAYQPLLCPGDLVMIYQAQGASIDVTNTSTYGDIINYNSAGLYEFKYVQSIAGNTITTQSTFTNSYATTGRVQIIKVPQQTTLTINSGASIVAKAWKDTTVSGTSYRFGGLVVIHSLNTINNGSVMATGSGFRGGQLNGNTNYLPGTVAYASTSLADGGEKGESIAGYGTEYDVNGGRHCRGASANGGGGGTSTNSSGGGGANGFNGNTWTGHGVMIVNAGNQLAAWTLDPAYIANSNALTNSSGGGRGGYAWGGNTSNPLVNGPGNVVWGGDNRREVGGRGGRPLNNINSETRIYFGGGGGAGDQNNTAGSAGANGGGIVYLITTSLTGTGILESNGNTAGNSINCNCDGVGGGGGGGSIIVKSTSVLNTQTVSAIGGNGGNELSPPANESEGGGGGGGGGLIAISATGIPQSVNGGLNGSTFATFMTAMTSDGGTQGATGQTVTVTPGFISFLPISNIVTAGITSPVCVGGTISFSTNSGGPYSWTGPNGFTSTLQNPVITNVTQAAAGFYFLNSYPCAGQLEAVVVPLPTVSIINITGSYSLTCFTPTIDLYASSSFTSTGALQYSWTSNNFSANTQTVNVVSASTLITLTAVSNAGCSSTATTAIQLNTVVPLSSVNPVNQSINCGPGAVATVTGTAISPTINVSHVWYGPGGVPPTIPVGGVTSIYNPGIVGSNGTSTFVLTNLVNGCSTTKTVQVVSSAGAYPSFAVTSNSTQSTFTLGCTTRSVTDVNIINGNTTPPGGTISYTILPPGFTGTNYTTTTANVYTINTPGTYTVIVKDNSNLCETRIPLPIVQNTFAPNIFASSSTRTLDCNVPTVALQGTTTAQNVTYVWKSNSLPPSVPNASIAVNTTSAGATVASATVIDVYTLTVVDASPLGNNCPSSTVVTMYQNTRPPRAAIAGAIPLTCLTFSVNLTNDSKTGVLPNTFFGTQPIIGLLWEGPTPQLPLNNSSTYQGYAAGIYTMTARDLNNGCTSQTTTTVGDNRVYPTIFTSSTVPLDCGAVTTGGVKLAATLLNLTASGVTAQWQTPSPTPIVSGINTLTLTTTGIGDYTLTVTTNSNGCPRSAFVKVTNGVLTADFSTDQTSGYAPLTVNFTNNSASSSTTSGTSSITSVWSFGNGTTRTTTTNIGTSAVYAQPGTYTVSMYAVKGSCVDTFVKVITVDIPSKLEVPNVFTPNGDGANDLFFIKTANLTEIKALIFDRWGNKIYELSTEKGNIAWDGQSNNGKEAPDGTYFYIITATGRDGQTYDKKGSISLYR